MENFLLRALTITVLAWVSSAKNCDMVCPAVNDPVCGSDGKVYSNACVLQVASCTTGENLTPVKNMTYCTVLAKLSSTEECNSVCTEVYKPVCGSDGEVYSNACKLGVAACTSEKELTPISWLSCLVLNLLAYLNKCDTQCPDLYKPVCGSDGEVYSNYCEMDVAACTTDQELKVKKMSFCEGGCDMVCPMDYTPVCGTDGKTYSNLCALNNKQCESEEWIQKAYDGHCIIVDCDSMCPTDYTPVCGTDGQTYSNMCKLAIRTCETNGTVELDHKGACEDLIVDCGYVCTADYTPVCGTDGQTYSNICNLEIQICETYGMIEFDHEGACEEEIL